MLNGEQVARVERYRGKLIRWRVEMRPSGGGCTLKMIDLRETRSMTLEVNRCIRDDDREMSREAGFDVPCLLVGIYGSDVDVALVNEDVVCHSEQGG